MLHYMLEVKLSFVLLAGKLIPTNFPSHFPMCTEFRSSQTRYSRPWMQRISWIDPRGVFYCLPSMMMLHQLSTNCESAIHDNYTMSN